VQVEFVAYLVMVMQKWKVELKEGWTKRTSLGDNRLHLIIRLVLRLILHLVVRLFVKNFPPWKLNFPSPTAQDNHLGINWVQGLIEYVMDS
jgi:hypothetical protein